MVSSAYGDDRGPMLSRMAVFGAAGALMTPVMFGAASAAGVTMRLWQLAGAATCVAAACVLVKIAPRSAFEPHGHPLQLLRDRWIVALIALIALEFGTEAIFGGWSAVYAIAVVPEAPPSVIIGLFWGGVCLARALAPLALARLAKREVVTMAASVAALGTIGMATASAVLPLAAATFVVGLALGPLAPTLISIAGDRYPRQMGTVIGLLLSAGQTGRTLLPWITGRVAVSDGFRAAMLVRALAIAGVAAGAMTVHLQRR
jgi:fucose permease